MHSGILGALLTFSPHVWHPLYERTSTTFGLTPLEDQQLAGLLMWVPAGVTFVAGGLYFFAAWLKESERRVLRAARGAGGHEDTKTRRRFFSDHMPHDYTDVTTRR